MSQPPLPQEDSATVEPSAPLGPGAASGSRRLSNRAWIGIFGGALAMILVVSLGSMIGARTDSPADPEPATAPVDPPAAEGSPEPSSAPGAGEGPGEAAIPLDERAEFSAGPFWAAPLGEGWAIEVFDTQGFNKFGHPASGCRFLSYQGAAGEEMAEGTDLDATASSLRTGMDLGLPFERLDDPPKLRQGSDVVGVLEGGGIQMIRLDAAYSSHGEARTRASLIRAFLPRKALLLAQVDCPAGEMKKVGEPALDRLSLTSL